MDMLGIVVRSNRINVVKWNRVGWGSHKKKLNWRVTEVEIGKRMLEIT